MKIGVFDSGIGGTTVLAAIQKILPDEEYKYIADSSNCPYGEKDDDELLKIVCHNVDLLLQWGARVIVVACNTATTRCLAQVRKIYPNVPFVGTEPAVKLACDKGGRNILVLATPATISSERLQELVDQNATNAQHFTMLPCEGLADAIEFNRNLDEKLHELFDNVPKDFDIIVLGCTHYPLIRDKIQMFFPNAELIDGNSGIAKQTQKIVESLR